MKSYFPYIAIFILCACSRQSEIQSMYSKWAGKEIFFPQELDFRIYPQDSSVTIDFNNAKIVHYIDSAECLSCKLDLFKWQSFMTKLPNIKFLTIIGNVETRDIKYFTFQHKFNHPIFIDHADSFNILNQFPKNDAFRTFLLDSANRVIAIGNPVQNMKIADLYMEILGVVSSIGCQNYTINLGTFNWREPQTALFKIANQRDAAWRIDTVTTSCECTTAKYSQTEVLPHDTLRVEVCYAAESASTFMREVYVHTNWQNEPITLTIEGSAVE
ncbi:MAG: DUF1573 domain-containing protein [Bacteroidales bacterium]|nr:DUF1573 domain-containing protein [Bacteroidales bacterium]